MGSVVVMLIYCNWNNWLWGVAFVTFCKIIGGMINFGSREIMSVIGWLVFVWIETSFRLWSRIESDIDLERFVFDWTVELPNELDEKSARKILKFIFS